MGTAGIGDGVGGGDVTTVGVGADVDATTGGVGADVDNVGGAIGCGCGCGVKEGVGSEETFVLGMSGPCTVLGAMEDNGAGDETTSSHGLEPKSRSI